MLPIYLVAMNVLALLLFGWDKLRARGQGWRIPETQLLLAAAAGGAPGAWTGMTLFRHKTRKRFFQIKLALATLANLLWLWLLWRL